MRSARIISPGKIEVLDEKIPSLDENKVLVRLLKTAICGSDLPYFAREFNPASYPLPSGYPAYLREKIRKLAALWDENVKSSSQAQKERDQSPSRETIQ